MIIDPFSELSGERFTGITEEQQGHRVLLFTYLNHRKDLPSPLVGLWLSNEMLWKSIESAHHIPDLECERALRASGAYLSGNAAVWLGLKVEMIQTEQAPAARVYLPKFMEENYSRLAIDREMGFMEELQSRFQIEITVTT